MRAPDHFERPTASDALNTAAVVGLTVIALLGFRSSYGGMTFLVVGSLAAVLGAVLALVTVKLDLPLAAGGVLALVSYAVIGGVLALPDRAVAGFLPSPDTILLSLEMAVVGWKELVTTAPPVGATGDLMVVPVFTGFVAACGGLSMALRLRYVAPALVPPVAALGLSIATGTDQAVSVLVQGSVFAVGAIAWLSWREHLRRPLLVGTRLRPRQAGAAALVLIAAAAGGFAISDRLPMASASDRDIWRQTITPPFDPRQHPSPLSGYRQYVKLDGRSVEPDDDDRVLFTVEGLPEGVPLRLATMDAFDGLVWQVSAGDPTEPSLSDSGSFERVGASIPPEADGEVANVVVTIVDYDDVWVPDVGEVISIDFSGSAGGSGRDRELADSFRYNRSTDTGASRVRLRSGDRYEMTVSLPTVLEDLTDEEIVPTVAHLGQTASVAEVVKKLAGPDLLAISDTGERLVEVRDTMREHGTYSDGDIEADQQRAQAGHSAHRLTGFVQSYPKLPLIGNAEQYAAAYALLFRDLDRIPTRVVMGFVPSEASVKGPVEVVSSQVEAWVEVPVEGRGWVAIAPTPPRDQTAITTSSPLQQEPDYRTQRPPPPPLIDPEFDQPATASGDAKGENRAERDRSGASEDSAWYSNGVLTTSAKLLSPIVVLGLALGFIVHLKTRRRRRRRSEGRAHERIANGWREVIDLARDMGHPVPAATTRREAALFVGGGTAVLAERADRAVWAGGEPTEDEVDAYWADLVEALDAMEHQLGLRDRLLAKISLQSLREEWVANRRGDR